MDVREKLMELLQDENNPVWRWFPNNASMMQLVDYLISNGVTVQEWISVKDRLPEDSGNYLVVHRNKYNGSISIAFEMYIKCKIGEWWENDYAYDVTHWMLLPEMPKENNYE